MEPMTLWQFYAVFLVLCVVGVALCYAMAQLATRCPLLGAKEGWGHKVRYKIAMVFLVLAAFTSYETLPQIVKAFTYDVSEAVAEGTVELGGKAIKGENITKELNQHLEDSLKGDKTGLVWGEHSPSQKDSLYLILGFWYFLAWCIYFGFFVKSPSTWWQKILKALAYIMLTSFILIFPVQIHYFSSKELVPPLVMLGIAIVLIFVTHDRTPAPPPLVPANKQTKEPTEY